MKARPKPRQFNLGRKARKTYNFDRLNRETLPIPSPPTSIRAAVDSQSHGAASRYSRFSPVGGPEKGGRGGGVFGGNDVSEDERRTAHSAASVSGVEAGSRPAGIGGG